MACIPLFASFPYRVNIFLSWEGAYRMSEGQVPFRDFGTPLGGMYWVVPAIFFKIFGPQMITLIKAQVFINIIAGLSFRSILRSLKLAPGIVLIAVILFCMSYSFFNFWPWYNHSVIVYQLVALAFLFRYFFNEGHKYRVGWLLASALFVCFSFLTKQDGGGLAFFICCGLLAYHCIIEKKWKPVLIFTGFFVIVLAIIISMVGWNSFGYWFNHGQAPHSSRVSPFEIVDEFFTLSQWIKFYLFLIILLIISSVKNWKEYWNNRRDMLFLLLTLAILGEATVFQVTSYTPPDNNIFFHSFAFAFILFAFSRSGFINFERRLVVFIGVIGVMLWWSSTYWKYMQRIVARVLPADEQVIAPDGENVVNRKTFMIREKDSADVPMSEWVYSDLKSFNKIYMPKATVDGMHRVMNLDIVRQHEDIKVLNMSELTPLAVEIPYKLEANSRLPLWYHLGVGMFNEQAALFEQRISSHYYDLVLFEYVPTLNNFYPFRVRDSLRVHYKLIDSFMAPRRGDTKGNIEVYVK